MKIGGLTDDEVRLIAQIGLTPGQIAWRRRQIESFKDKFQQEYPESADAAFLAGDKPYHDVTLLARMDIRPPIRITLEGLMIWVEPQGDVTDYIIGADCGLGGPIQAEDEEQSLGTGDFSAAAVMNPRTGQFVATFEGRVKPDPYAGLLIEWGRMYHTATLVVERNYMGAHVLKAVVDAKYPKIYVSEKSTEGPDGRPDFDYGFYTSPTSKYAVLADWDEALRTGATYWHDSRLSSEVRTFVRRVMPSGKVVVGAQPGASDDLYRAAALAYFLRLHALTSTGQIIHGRDRFGGRREWI